MTIFIFGRVYDLDDLTIDQIEKEITERMIDHTRVKNIKVNINIRSKNSVLVNIGRNLDLELDEDTILEQDTWLITGEGYEGFMPRYCMKPPFPHSPNINYFFDRDEFIRDYKKEAVYQGASRIKNARIVEGRKELNLYLSL